MSESRNNRDCAIKRTADESFGSTDRKCNKNSNSRMENNANCFTYPGCDLDFARQQTTSISGNYFGVVGRDGNEDGRKFSLEVNSTNANAPSKSNSHGIENSGSSSKSEYSEEDLFNLNCYKLLELVNDLASGLSPIEPIPCGLERSDSWEFAPSSSSNSRANNDRCAKLSSAASLSSLSSLSTLSDFDEVLRVLGKGKVNDEQQERVFNLNRNSGCRRSFAVGKRNSVARESAAHNALLKKWNSSDYIDVLHQRKSNRSLTRNCCTFDRKERVDRVKNFADDSSIDLSSTAENVGLTNSYLTFEERYLLPDDSVGESINEQFTDEAVIWDWLFQRENQCEKTRDEEEEKIDNTDNNNNKDNDNSSDRDNDDNQLLSRRQPDGNHSTSAAADSSSWQFRSTMANYQTATDVPSANKRRSWSVTLKRSNDVVSTARSTASSTFRNLARSSSVYGVTASDAVVSSRRNPEHSGAADCSAATRTRTVQNGWSRASMRFVRPFRLADPSTSSWSSSTDLSIDENRSVAVQLPPIFPCDLIERSTAIESSSDESNRPRQYGRMGERYRESQRSLIPSSDQLIDNPEGPSAPNRVLNVRITADQNPIPFRLNASNDRSSRTSSSDASSHRFTTFRTYEMTRESDSPLGQWNHSLSSILACLGCTLGIFNISRFAIFSVHFGTNFIMQFLILTLLIGVPLFCFHISLGQLLGTGVLDMWHISPIFKGIGISLLLSQAFIGIYSIIGVSWMLVYFRDSFISKQDVYRWAEFLELYGEDGVWSLKNNNGSSKIERTVPDYFNGVVLQRRSILKPEEDLMNIKFSVAFNLTIVWIIIFLSLSKGIKSYGKVVYAFSLLPTFGMFLLCAKLLGFVPNGSKSRSLFPETDWNEFFLNSKSWVAAFTEVFLTWGVFGASAMQLTSHNQPKHFLHRDASLVIVLTISVLLLSSFLANTCFQILDFHNYKYLISSFEKPATYTFLQKNSAPLNYNYINTPIRWMVHSGLLLGERTIKPNGNVLQESGYQALRLATELVPSTFAVVGVDIMSQFWAILFYFVFISFGILQQLAIWYTVISGIVTINVKSLKPCWTTITWFVCVSGLVLGLPMTTEMGIFVVYFLDYTIGCGWWIMILYLLQLGAVFIVRGRPYSGETIVATLFTHAGYFLQNWIAPMLSFNWNVILPVTLLLLSTSVFKYGGYRMLYNWHSTKFYEYWPPWCIKLGCFIQIWPLFLVPLVGIIQTYRYLSDGPPDLFDRIQLLYRPVMDSSQNRRDLNQTDSESNRNNTGGNTTLTEDPPPKYTPPPSYSTATGARIAKLLRQSFRRSVRRIAHVLSTTQSTSSTIEEHQSTAELPPPPDYSSVLVEINQSLQNTAPVNIVSNSVSNNSNNDNDTTNNSNNSNVNISVSNINDNNSIDDSSNVSLSPSTALTVEDVTNILRTSFRSAPQLQNNLAEQECTSIQCLVDSAAPINHDSIILNNLKECEEQL